jgi:hypothetical protein
MPNLARPQVSQRRAKLSRKRGSGGRYGPDEDENDVEIDGDEIDPLSDAPD